MYRDVYLLAIMQQSCICTGKIASFNDYIDAGNYRVHTAIYKLMKLSRGLANSCKTVTLITVVEVHLVIGHLEVYY